METNANDIATQRAESRGRRLARAAASVAAVTAAIGLLGAGSASASGDGIGENDRVPAYPAVGPLKTVNELVAPAMSPLEQFAATRPVVMHLSHYHLQDPTWEFRSLTGAPDENVAIHMMMTQDVIDALK